VTTIPAIGLDRVRTIDANLAAGTRLEDQRPSRCWKTGERYRSWLWEAFSLARKQRREPWLLRSQSQFHGVRDIISSSLAKQVDRKFIPSQLEDRGYDELLHLRGQ
jgi:hypothetical protein